MRYTGDTFTCGTWQLGSWWGTLVTDSHVGHVSFVRVTWRAHNCHVTRSHSYASRDSFVCVTQTHASHDSFICVTWLIRMCHVTQWLTMETDPCSRRCTLSYEPYPCATRRIRKCHMTHPYVSHDSTIDWGNRSWDPKNMRFLMSHTHKWHDSSIRYESRLIRKRIFVRSHEYGLSYESYSYESYSCVTLLIPHGWVMSHMSHIRKSHVTHMKESCHTYETVTSHIWKSHVTHTNESCRTFERVMSHIRMSHVTHLKES